MAKMTVLEMTQNILEAMTSDDVNSIADTVESQMVSNMVKEAYFFLLGTREDWPFLRTKTTFTALADATQPTSFTMPDGLNHIKWVKYNGADVTFMEPYEFQTMLDGRTAQAGVVDANGIGLNADPTYWTTFDDVTVVMDSYDSTVDSTLQSSKTVVYGCVTPVWTQEDSFIPNLPEKFFPTLLAEAKAACFLNIKQQGNGREERRAAQGKAAMQKFARKEVNGDKDTGRKVNYGRNR